MVQNRIYKPKYDKIIKINGNTLNLYSMEFIINKTKYTTKPLNINDFNDFSGKLANLTDFYEMSRLVLSYYTNIPQRLINAISEESLAEIEIKDIIVSKKVDINFDFNKITVGKFIDIEEFLKVKNYQYAVAVMNLPIDYYFDDIQAYPVFQADTAISFISGFNEWKINLFKMYDDVVTLADTKAKIKKNEDKGNTWLELVQFLADYDATDVKQQLIYKRTLTSLLLTLRLKKNASKNN